MKTSVRIALIALSVLMLASCKGEKATGGNSRPFHQRGNTGSKRHYADKRLSRLSEFGIDRQSGGPVNGYLRTSHLVAGSKVKKGELIFVIEPDTYQDNVTQAEAALKTSKAQLDYARSNYERMKEAAKSGAVSQIQVLQAQSTAQGNGGIRP